MWRKKRGSDVGKGKGEEVGKEVWERCGERGKGKEGRYLIEVFR